MAKIIGRKKMLEMVLTGEMFPAAEAETLGLVNKVVAADELEQAEEEVSILKEQNTRLRLQVKTGAEDTRTRCKEMVVEKNLLAVECANLTAELRDIKDVHEPRLTTECDVCFEENMVGLSCSRGGHSVCLGCFLKDLADRHTVSNLVVRGQEVYKYCAYDAGEDCMAPVHGLLQLCDKKEDLLAVVLAMNHAKEYERERELVRVNIAHINETKKEKLLKQVNEEILTLTCPSCKKSFHDFKDCAALQCSLCKNDFCGWCFKYCASFADSHAHVRQCIHNPDIGTVFTNLQDWTVGTIAYRKGKVETFLSELSLTLQFEIMADVKQLCDTAFA